MSGEIWRAPPHYSIDVILLHKPRAACVAQQSDLHAPPQSYAPPQIYSSPDDYLLAAILIESCLAGNDAVPGIQGLAVQRMYILAKVAAIEYWTSQV